MAIIEVKEEENRDNGIQNLYKRIRIAQERTFNTGAKRDSNENKP